MISIIITAWEEPEEVKECLKRFTTQKNLKEDYEILAIAPDEPTKKEIMKYVKKYPKSIHFFLQPREKGKNRMLNLLIKKAKGSIIIFADGDVFVNETAVSEIFNAYKNPKVGAVTGRIVPKNLRDNMLGYWAHLLTYGAHKIREQRFKRKQFLECSGYLYSIRNGLINEIPMDVAEDSIMPLMIWKKGYQIAYADKALGYVLYPETFEKWMNQKTRCAKAHEKLDDYGGKRVRMKTFKNEILKGTIWALTYPQDKKELNWTFQLFFARLKVWKDFFIETKIKNQHYGETWNKIHADNKIKTCHELSFLIPKLKREGKKIVWTNGCFDIIHQGHIRHLKDSKRQGDILIVGLNSDSSVREIKGPSRPMQSEDMRAEVLSAFSFVDYIIIFSEQRPVKYIKILQPDIYSKGGEYNIDTCNQEERRMVESYGGKIVFTSEKVNSTTDLIRKIKNS